MTASTATATDAPPVAVTASQIDVWTLQLDRLGRLLALASDHLGEDIPYVGAAVQGVDTVDAVIDGASALVRQLAEEMRRADAPVFP